MNSCLVAAEMKYLHLSQSDNDWCLLKVWTMLYSQYKIKLGATNFGLLYKESNNYQSIWLSNSTEERPAIEIVDIFNDSLVERYICANSELIKHSGENTFQTKYRSYQRLKSLPREIIKNMEMKFESDRLRVSMLFYYETHSSMYQLLLYYRFGKTIISTLRCVHFLLVSEWATLS